MRNSIFILLTFSVWLILASCKHKKEDAALDSIQNDSIIVESYYSSDSSFSISNSGLIPENELNISDGESEHYPNLSQEEINYHAKRNVSTLEDAYLEGYEDGYDDGEEDGSRGKRYGHSYDPDSDFTGKFATSYEAGYDDGYSDGYNSSLDDDDDNLDE